MQRMKPGAFKEQEGLDGCNLAESSQSFQAREAWEGMQPSGSPYVPCLSLTSPMRMAWATMSDQRGGQPTLERWPRG